MAETTTQEQQEQKSDGRGLQKERFGEVVSNKMDKTVVVKVTRMFSHPLYKKYLRRSKNYYAHDENNECNIGDSVRIVETRPMSKQKRWRVAEITRRAK